MRPVAIAFLVVVIIIIIFKPTSTKPQAGKLDVQNYGCNGNLLCYYYH